MGGWPSGRRGKKGIQIISTTMLYRRLKGRMTVRRERSVAFWMRWRKRHQKSHSRAPKRKYCSPQAPRSSARSTWRFQSRESNHSWNAKRQPNSVEAERKTAGCIKNGCGEVDFVPGRFSGHLDFLQFEPRPLSQVIQGVDEGTRDPANPS